MEYLTPVVNHDPALSGDFISPNAESKINLAAQSITPVFSFNPDVYLKLAAKAIDGGKYLPVQLNQFNPVQESQLSQYYGNEVIVLPNLAFPSKAKEFLQHLEANGCEVVVTPEAFIETLPNFDNLDKAIYSIDFNTPVVKETPKVKKLVDLDKTKVHDMVYTAPNPFQFLLKDKLRLGLAGMLEGEGGASKSTTAMMLQVSIATGVPFLGYYEIAPEAIGESFGIYGEEGADDLHYRLHHIMTELNLTIEQCKQVAERVHMFSMVDSDHRSVLVQDSKNTVTTTGFVEEIIATVEDLKHLKLVVIDPLAKYYGGGLYCMDDAYRFSHELKKICSAKGATVLTINHVNKAGLKDTTNLSANGFGSVGFRNSSRFMINMRLMTASEAKKLIPDEPDLMNFYVKFTFTKGNYGPPETGGIWLKRGNYGVLQHVELIEQDDDSAEDTNYLNVVNFVEKCASEGTQCTKTLVRETPINSDSGCPIPNAKKLVLLADLVTNKKLLEIVPEKKGNKMIDTYKLITLKAQLLPAATATSDDSL